MRSPSAGKGCTYFAIAVEAASLNVGAIELGQGESKQHHLVVRVQTQRSGKARQKPDRDRDRAAALKPAIPVFGYADQFRYLLPP